MVSINNTSHGPRPKWHTQFLTLLPAIHRYADRAFQDFPAEAREEFVQEVSAYALLAFVRLVQLDKTDMAYASPLARYGIARVRDGRHVGGKLNTNEISSRYCQRKKGFTVNRLDRRTPHSETWQEVLVEDRHAGPAEIAMTRIDFQNWLCRLSNATRQIAEALAIGETTGAVARRFGISSARVSQLRRLLAENWSDYQSERRKSVCSATCD